MSDDRLEDIPRRLREYIEYATAARRFADVGFYQSVLAEVERLRSQHAEMVKFNERQYERAEKAEAALRRISMAYCQERGWYRRQAREALSAIEAKE